MGENLPAQTSVADKARLAWLAAPLLGAAPLEKRNRAILAFQTIIERERSAIIQANKADAGSRTPEEFKAGRMSIDDHKIDTVLAGFAALLKMPDPLGAIDLARELDQGLNLYRVRCPIGVIGIIFEARPDVLPQIAALALKSGNAVLLKGGQEVEQINQILFACLQEALKEADLPEASATLLGSRADVAEMLKAERYIDLIIPRGSNQLVTYIQSNTKIPVLGHAEGICHVYVHSSADLSKAIKVVVDSKIDYPSACNSSETLLLDRALDQADKLAILRALADKGVKLHISEPLRTVAAAHGLACLAIEEQSNDFRCEWGNLTMSVAEVEDSAAAIAHINEFGSGHTDSIVCEDQSTWALFFARVRSAGVYLNASTRFADGFRYGFGAEVGISTGKLPPRGPVGLEGLTTYKYKIEGQGHAAGDYSRGERSFSHRELPVK